MPQEGDKDFDPRKHGNKKYGPGAVFPKAPAGSKFSSRAGSVSGSKQRVASHGTGPGPKGSYPNVQKAAGRRLAEDDKSASWTSAKTGGKVTGPLNRMVPGDTRRRKGQRAS